MCEVHLICGPKEDTTDINNMDEQIYVIGYNKTCNEMKLILLLILLQGGAPLFTLLYTQQEI